MRIISIFKMGASIGKSCTWPVTMSLFLSLIRSGCLINTPSSDKSSVVATISPKDGWQILIWQFMLVRMLWRKCDDIDRCSFKNTVGPNCKLLCRKRAILVMGRPISTSAAHLQDAFESVSWSTCTDQASAAHNWPVHDSWR